MTPLDREINVPINNSEYSLLMMLKTDRTLYEKIIDTPVFAFHFNQLCLRAREGDKAVKNCVCHSMDEVPMKELWPHLCKTVQK